MGELLILSKQSERQKDNIDRQVSKIVSQLTTQVEHFLSRNAKKTLNEEEIKEMLEKGLKQFPSMDFD